MFWIRNTNDGRLENKIGQFGGDHVWDSEAFSQFPLIQSKHLSIFPEYRHC
jgi:hypothetical protein